MMFATDFPLCWYCIYHYFRLNLDLDIFFMDSSTLLKYCHPSMIRYALCADSIRLMSSENHKVKQKNVVEKLALKYIHFIRNMPLRFEINLKGVPE